MLAARDIWFRDEILPLERELRSYLRRFFGEEDAKDIVQQCYAQICAMVDYTAIQSPRAFLFVTARNLGIQRVRHDRVVPMELVAELEDLSVLENAAPSAERVSSAREELRMLSQVIERMPAQCRQVFTLRKVYGFSQKEIAERLGITEHTVEKHVSKGVRLCTEYLLGLAGAERVVQPESSRWSWKRKKASDGNAP